MVVLLALLAVICVVGSACVWAIIFRAIIDNWRPW